MSQRTRILVAVLILVVIAGAVLGIDALKRRPAAPATGASAASAPAATAPAASEAEATAPAASAPTSTALPTGAVPIYVDGQLAGGITAKDVEPIAKVSFTDKAEGVGRAAGYCGTSSCCE